MSKKAKKAGILSGAAISITVLVCAGILLGSMNEPIVATSEKPEEHLFIEETYLLKTGETNETVNVTCIPYMTNIWDEESGDIKVIAYVVKTSNKIADFKNTVEFEKIAGDTTAELKIPIILTSDNFKVDLLIFEDEKLGLKGSFTVRAKQTFKYDGEGLIVPYSSSWTIANSDCIFEAVQHDVQISIP